LWRRISIVHATAAAKRWDLTPADHERLTRAATLVFSPHPRVLAVYLYGSAARGEPAVDLDVAVLCEVALDPEDLDRLAVALQEHGAPAGPPIDLRPLVGAGARFQVNVLKEGQVLFERDRGRRLVQEAQIMGRWADYLPTWEQMRHRMLERWRRG
jgi:predicted nucleotidyltransferase